MTLRNLLDVTTDTLFNLYDLNGEYITADWHDKEDKSYPYDFVKYLDHEVTEIKSKIEYDEESITDDNPTGEYSVIEVTLKLIYISGNRKNEGCLYMAVLDGYEEITAFSTDKETAKRLACKKKRELYPESVKGQSLHQIWEDNGVRVYKVTDGSVITEYTESID